jgi:peptidoglycan/LPS O-acetylase OafA/YrhL
MVKPTDYHPHIDGLRAIAILAVVGFHVSPQTVHGGFQGVDIFFVISGFLITSILWRELRQKGSIDLLGFYARRVRRLIPALLTVVLATIVLGMIMLVPADGEIQRLANSVPPAVFYYANWHFSTVGFGYFDAPSNLYPLLHTWSLAVEEQFYIVWPLILIGLGWLYAARKRPVRVEAALVLLTAVGLASFFFSLWAALSDEQAERAFFSVFARAWQLGIGAGLALITTLVRLPRWPGIILAVLGLLVMLGALAMVGEANGFPEPAALLVTLATAAVICGGMAAPQSLVVHALALPPLVWIGRFSYGWYLWHWPLLAIARSNALGVENVWRDTGIVFAALLLSGITYVLIEEPFRRRRIWKSLSDVWTLAAALAASLAVIAAGFGLQSYSASDRLARVTAAENDAGWSNSRCYKDSDTILRGYTGLPPLSDCLVGSDIQRQKTLLVWGDSHADHMVGALEAADKDGQLAILSRPQGLCPPLLNAIPAKRKRPFEPCRQFNADVLAEIMELHKAGQLAAVVVSGHWALYTARPKLAGGAGVPLFMNGRWYRRSEAPQALAEALRGTLLELTRNGIRVLVIAPMAEQKYRVPACLARRPASACSAQRTLAEEHRRPALEAVKAAAAGLDGVYLWDPLPSLCDGGTCWAERGNVVMYRDGDHLTYEGAKWLGSPLRESPEWKAFTAPPR